MDTVKSWLDAKELRRMAEELLEPSKGKPAADADAGYGEKFEGYTKQQEAEPSPVKQTEIQEEKQDEKDAQASPLAAADQGGSSDAVVDPAAKVRASVSNALAGARKVAEGSGMLQGVGEESKPASQPAAKQPDIIKVDVAKAKQSSSQWCKTFGFSGVVLVEGREQVLLDTLGNPMITQIALRLTKTVPDSGQLFVKVGAGSCLQVLSLGPDQVVFGALLPSPLSVEQLAGLRAQLVEDLA